MSVYDQENDRDPRLGAALRALPVPDHGPGFWDDLEARLDELSARPRVALGGDPAEEPHVLATPAEVRTSAAATRRATPRRLRQPRFPRPPRTRRAPHRLRGGGRRRTPAPALPRLGPVGRRRRVALAVAAAAVVAVTVGLAWWAESRDPHEAAGSGPGVSSAPTSETTLPVLTGPASAWSGELVLTETDDRSRATTTRFSVASQQDGATRVTALDGGQPADVGDDPSVGVRVEVGAARTARTTGLSPATLDHSGTAGLLHRHYADVVAAQAAAGDPAVVAGTLEGRSVWRFAAALVPDQLGEGGADHVELVVDQTLRVPLHVVERRAGTVLRELTLTIAPGMAGTPPGLPTLDPGDEDGGEAGPWRPATAADARLVVAALPEGFVAAAAAVADEAPGGGPEGANPAGRATQVVYRRGWEQVVVTVWATGPDRARWSDPLAVEGVPAAPVAVPLTGGALAGTSAQVVVQADYEPHLWAVGADHVVLVSGPLTATALVALASSLAPPT